MLVLNTNEWIATSKRSNQDFLKNYINFDELLLKPKSFDYQGDSQSSSFVHTVNWTWINVDCSLLDSNIRYCWYSWNWSDMWSDSQITWLSWTTFTNAVNISLNHASPIIRVWEITQLNAWLVIGWNLSVDYYAGGAWSWASYQWVRDIRWHVKFTPKILHADWTISNPFGSTYDSGEIALNWNWAANKWTQAHASCTHVKVRDFPLNRYTTQEWDYLIVDIEFYLVSCNWVPNGSSYTAQVRPWATLWFWKDWSASEIYRPCPFKISVK